MTHTVSRRQVLGALAALPLAGLAQGIPSTVRIVVAYPAGGVSDVVARALADKLAVQLDATVIIENKAGASGTIGMDMVAKAAPDGATLGFSAVSPLVLNPHLGKSPFDPLKDIAPVASVMVSPVVLAATPACAAADFKSLLELARSQPGTVRWATSGQASLGHIMLAQLRAVTGVDITHIPYKGGGQQLNDALGGQFEILSTNAGPALINHIRGGKLRPLAVGSPTRLDSLPQVPTLAELGVPSANLSSQFGIFAPAGLPAALLARYNTGINQALATPDLRAKLQASDNLPTGGTAAEFARAIAAEHGANGRIIRAAKISAE